MFWEKLANSSMMLNKLKSDLESKEAVCKVLVPLHVSAVNVSNKVTSYKPGPDVTDLSALSKVLKVKLSETEATSC